MATQAASSATEDASKAVTDRTSHIADPGALGLAGFAATTFVLSCFNAGLFAEKLEPVVLPLALVYGGLAQLLAGMWEFRKGNTFGATAFGSYGSFWISLALLIQFYLPELEAAGASSAEADQAVGLYLLAWTIFTAIMLVASLRTNGALVTVFVALLATFVCLTIGDLAGAKAAGTLGGYLGILTALIAWYTAAAVVINNTAGKAVLPVGARS